jgi:proteasome beta subunit
MEKFPISLFDHEPTGGDFARLLARVGVPTPRPQERAAHVSSSPSASPGLTEAHGTTVIAVKFDDGVLNVADRRATAATGILYDEAEKILKLDDYTLIAVAGAYAQAAEAARYLRHSFKYFARSQLQEMSLDGKLAEVSRVLAQSVPSLLQGIGGFVPVISAYDPKKREGRIFFYDILGARFESREWSAAGSGAEKIRGALAYIARAKKPFHEMALDEALRETLLLLDIAAGLDPATAGLTGPPPLAKVITQEGVADVPEERVHEIQQELTGR